MTVVKLFKHHPDQLLAHLYEHIWVAHVSSYLRERNLYTYIDYTIDAITNNDGLIDIRVHLYTDEATEFQDRLKDITIIINEETIQMGLMQVMAELKTALDASPHELLDQLSKLDGTKWDTEISMQIGQKVEGSVIDRLYELETQTVELHISTDSTKNAYDIAAFYIFSLILASNLQEDLSDGYGLFTEDDDTEISRGKMTFINRFSSPLAAYHFTDEKTETNNLLQNLLREPVLERFIEHIQNSNDSKILPFDTLNKLTHSELAINSWKKEITLTRLRSIAEHASVSLVANDNALLVK